MINGSVVAPTDMMSEKESLEAFLDGAKLAYSAAMELAKEDVAEWENIASTMRALHDGCKKLYDMKAMSRFETLMATNLKANPKGFIH